MTLAQKLYITGCEYAEGWNFGPTSEGNKAVGEVLDYLVAHWPSDVSWVLDKRAQPHEAQLLKLDISKAKERLKWSPRWDLNTTLKKIIEWHDALANEEDMRAFTLSQIADFEESSG